MSHSNKSISIYQKRQCTACNGKGSILEMGEERCQHCAGTGRDNKSDCCAEPCIFCNGTGKKYYCRKMMCRSCRGSGSYNF